MAEFPQVRAGDDWNPLMSAYDANAKMLQNQLAYNTLGSRTRIAQNTADSGTQDLTDRASLRSLAGGLASGDTSAVANAAVLPNGPGAVTAVLPFFNQQSNATTLGDIRKSLLPADPASGVGAGASGATAQPFVATNLPPGIDPVTDQIVRTVYGEAGGESPTGQQAVASVIRNRALQSGMDPTSVIFAPGQFEPWNNPTTRAKLEALDPASPEYQSILKTIRPTLDGSAADPTGGATHFYSPAAQAALGRQPPSWGQGPAQVIGGHQFYKLGYAPGSGAPGAPPAPAGGVAARTGGTDVAGPGAGAPQAQPQTDHPAQPLVQALAAHIMSVPPEQRPALYAQFRPAAIAAGATAPEQYPGDDVIAHLAGGGWGHPNAAAAPGVALAPGQAAAPGAVQVAGPGVPTAQPAAPPVGTQGVDDVMARLRAGQGSRDPSGGTAIPGLPSAGAPPNPMLVFPPGNSGLVTTAAPASTPAVAPPVAATAAPSAPTAISGHAGPLANLLLGDPIQPAAQNRLADVRPPFMPSASAAPPAGAVRAPVVVQAGAPGTQSNGQPAPGLPPPPLVLLPNGLTAQQTTDFINLSKRRTTDPAALTTAIEAARQQNRTAQQQYFTDTKPVTEYVGGQAITRSPVTGQEVGPRYTVPDTRRVSSDDENGFRVVRNADGQILSSTPTGGYKVATLAYDRDAKEIAGIADAGHGAQSDNIRIQAMRDALANLPTGSGGTTRAAMASFVQTYLPDQAADFIKSIANLPDAAVAQEFSKLALKGVGTQERQVLGARGGYQAMRLFQATNPGLDLLPGANRAILGMQLIGNQADADYSQGAQAWFTRNEDQLGTEGKYASLAHYDKQWQQQRQPQIYAAAMGALAGLPVSNGDVGGKSVKGWATGLSDQEYQQALSIVSRADPSAKVNGRTGPLSMQPQNGGGGQAAPVVSTPVQHQNLAPGTTYVDPDGNTRMRR